MPARRLTFVAVVALACTLHSLPPMWAQDRVPAVVTVPGTGKLRTQLERMRYNPGERGPLLCMTHEPEMNGTVPVKRALPGDNDPGPTPLMLADAFERRLLQAGSITVLAPREMTVINANPGKANPLADMRSSEIMKVFLGTLSEGQWQKMSGDGIGLADMDKDQVVFMRQLLPHVSAVRHSKVVAAPDRFGGTRYEDDGERVVVNPEQFRLRLSLIATYMFTSASDPNRNYLSGNYRSPKSGDRIWRQESTDNTNGRDRSSAFGVKIVETQANRLKQGELDFAAPVLDAAVSLDTSDEMPLKTLGDLLTRVRSATKLDLYADARITKLPLYVRSAPGQSVRAGDVLMALAYSVTGAYRRLGPRTFLLTDNVEGIGTRFARLDTWANAARAERQRLLISYQQKAAKKRPLRFLKFSAGFNTLPDDLSQKIESGWQKNGGLGVKVPVSSLSQTMRKAVEDARDIAAREIGEGTKEPVSLNTEQVMLSMTAHAQWVLRDGVTIDAPGVTEYSFDVLRGMYTADPLTPASAPKADMTSAQAPVFPPTLTRRIVVLPPTTAVEAKQMIALAKARGFSEAWVSQSLDDADFSPLKAAISAAKPLKMKVVAVVPLLRHRKGAEDRTILGMTGAQWAEFQLQQLNGGGLPASQSERQIQRNTGWLTPPPVSEEKLLSKRLLALCAVPGVAGVCLVSTTPPGYGDTQYSDGLMPGSEQGYTLSRRIAFLSGNGFDPVDIIQNTGVLDIEKSLPFFTNESSNRYKQVGDDWVADTSYTPPVTQWRQFRTNQVHRYLAALHGVVREAFPTLPLYIEDRVSAHGFANNSWYGSWDHADRLPINPPYSDDAGGLAAARAASTSLFLRLDGPLISDDSDSGEQFAAIVQRIAKQAETPGKPWAGIALDLSDGESKAVLRLLEGLPVVSVAR